MTYQPDLPVIVEMMEDKDLPELPEGLTLYPGVSLASVRRYREMLLIGGLRSTRLQIGIDAFFKKRGVADEDGIMRKVNDETEMLSGYIETETPRAILFKSDNMDAAVWIPTSQITKREELGGDMNRVEIHVKSWLVRKNGFE